MNKFAKTLLPPDSPDVDAAKTSVTLLKNNQNEAVNETTIFRVGMRNVNATIKYNVSAIPQENYFDRVRLDLKGKGGINGLNQFRTSTF